MAVVAKVVVERVRFTHTFTRPAYVDKGNGMLIKGGWVPGGYHISQLVEMIVAPSRVLIVASGDLLFALTLADDVGWQELAEVAVERVDGFVLVDLGVGVIGAMNGAEDIVAGEAHGERHKGVIGGGRMLGLARDGDGLGTGLLGGLLT